MLPRSWRAGVALLVSVAVAGCSGGAAVSTDQASSTTPEVSESPSPTASPQPETLAWGPTVDDWDAALAIAQSLSLREAASAVILPAYSAEDPDELEAQVRSGLAGAMLMGDATGSAATSQSLAAAAQAGAADRGWPALVAVDQEGGTVARLTEGVAPMPAFMAAGAVADLDLVTDTYAQAGAELHALGFTVDFAPVADVTVGLPDPVIRTRSAGDEAQAVAETVVAAALGYVEGGIAPTVKHFPGHGSVTTDSHEAVPTLAGPLTEIESGDMEPFRAAIDAGVPVVMMSHVAVEAWGSVPASLDPQAYAALRDELGFTGVAVTDALNMGAITEDRDPGEAAVEALAAGADLLLMPASTKKARTAIVDAVGDGTLERERLDEAAARVILLARWQDGLEPSVAVDDGYAAQFSLAAVTVGAKDCAAPFVGASVSISGGFAADRDRLAAALESRGVSVGSSGTSIWITGSDDGAGKADVVVAMGGPWALESSTARVKVAAYGRGVDALDAVAAVLVGDVEPRGQWPVELAGVPDAC